MTATNTSRLLALDWGTSALRAVLLDSAGHTLREHSSDNGILRIAPGGFAAFFDSHFADWMQGDATLCLISGMAGSQSGWAEAPYCPCPAGFAELTARLPLGASGRIAIVPGLSCWHEGVAGSAALERVPDVLRGEEVQVFGALQLQGLRDAQLVLPGTHSKWVQVQDGRVARFRTSMTGELFALLRGHSLLARSLPPAGQDLDTALDTEAFDEAVQLALRGPGLLSTAFSTRTLSLWGSRTPAALLSHLSGLVIGEELRSQTLDAGSAVTVIAAPALQLRYARALAQLGITASCLGAEATWRGHQAIHEKLRLAT